MTTMTTIDQPVEPVDLVSVLESSGITQREFADLVGVTRVTVNRWVAGLSAPSPAIDRVVHDVAFILSLAVSEGWLPGNLPAAHGRTIEDRKRRLEKIVAKARRRAKRMR